MISQFSRGRWQAHSEYVGASLLAMDVNDNACFLDKRVVLKSIASKLAPTYSLCACHVPG